MRKTIAIGVWMLLAAFSAAWAQEAPAKAPAATEPPGKRLRVRFQEIRGGSTTATRAYTLLLHAGAEGARAFVGAQARITVADKQAPATLFKNAGVETRVRVETLPDGRYRLAAKYERSSVLGAGGGGGAPLPVTAAPVPAAAPAAGGEEARLRARLVLVRRQGDAKVVRRPYSLVLQAGGEEAANVFSGSMLPLQVTVDGKPTVALKDVGAGLRVSARRLPDGRHRLDVSFSDGALSAGRDFSPQVRTFESESQLFVQEGEAVTVVSAVDPDTGEVVEAEVTVEGVP
jgi:hypothetical protein